MPALVPEVPDGEVDGSVSARLVPSSSMVVGAGSTSTGSVVPIAGGETVGAAGLDATVVVDAAVVVDTAVVVEVLDLGGGGGAFDDGGLLAAELGGGLLGGALALAALLGGGNT